MKIRGLGVLLMLLHIGLRASSPALGQVPEAERAVDTALAAFNAAAPVPWAYHEVGRTLDPEYGGVVYLELRDRTTHVAVPGIIEWAVVLPDGPRWSVFLPGDSGYTEALRSLPDGLRAQFDDSIFRVPPNPDLDASLTLTDYHLPWEEGQWGTVTRSFGAHGRGKIDFDIAGRAVAAAKDGMIVYANDSNDVNGYDAGAWWYWNTVIIEHGPGEYTLYGHLAPGSIPERIKNQCSDSFHGPNCFVPVRAGETIAREGNSGYSRRDHLHFEAGQSFGVVPYPDLLDGDRDGDRAELVYGGDVYREHNIAFLGYTIEEVAAWERGRLEQAAHIIDVPPGVNLVLNGDFTVDTSGWSPSGQINWEVADGILRFLRLRNGGSPQWATFYQDLAFGVPAHLPLEVGLALGNDSRLPKEIAVSLRNAAGWQYDYFTCRFILPPSTPLQPYVVRGRSRSTWSTARLEIGVNPPDSAPAALVDNIVVRYVPSAEWSGIDCISPGSDDVQP